MNLVMYVLYENPSDYRGKFVLRRQVGPTPDPRPVIVTPNMLEALAALPRGVTKIGRNQGDDPAIQDVWAVV
jgi:hypothetical protein